jgi:gamma-glutamylcyclotransferase (GGCT)/AIG2-like uncharacterized protein YtfP
MSYLTYFAYGSNMLTERLRRRVPSTTPIGRAHLGGWKLRFHKHGADGSAKCNIVSAAEADVFGVLFEIRADERKLLDRAEGLGRGYDLAEVSVTLDGASVDAFCYVASPSHIDESLLPFRWYRDFVLHGAHEHRLPAPYAERVQRIEALRDADRRRAKRNRSILGATKVAEDAPVG